ncbi:MAG: SDR family oxidoreductase [Oligosphaeraceae bacterium]|nr:SDR family oxidoreductase [Oligosphaeraceae bacterium]
MSARLSGKTVLISGGAQGIGKAGAARCVAEGADVWIADINEQSGKATAAELGCHFIKCDVSRTEDVQAVFEAMPKVDVIYNNAGIYWAGHDGRVTDIREEDWDRIIAINLRSVYLFCKYGIARMMATGGSVINTASSAGIIGIPDCDAYTATKGAIVQLTKSMAAEYGRYNIRVNCIAPAAIMTPMMRQSNPENSTFDEERFLKLRTPLRRYGTPEEIANIALFLASDESSYLNGAIIVADGGITINGDLSKI